MTNKASGLTQTGASLSSLNQAASSFGTAISEAFSKGVVQGKSFDDVLQSVGAKLLDLAAKAAVPNLGANLSSGTQNRSDYAVNAWCGWKIGIGGAGCLDDPCHD